MVLLAIPCCSGEPPPRRRRRTSAREQKRNKPRPTGPHWTNQTQYGQYSSRIRPVQAALSELTESVTAVLGLCGSWVTMADDGRLRSPAAVSQVLAKLERDHEQLHPCPCPCRDAYSTGEVVRVTDVRQKSTRWPQFSASATRVSIDGVAAIPMRLADQVIGALSLYDAGSRAWSDEDIAMAGVLADLATSYVVNASKLRQQEQLSEQLQHARDSWRPQQVRTLTCPSNGLPQPAQRFAGGRRAGVRVDLQRHRHVCVTQDSHDHPRVDFQIHQKRCARPPRVVNRPRSDAQVASGSM
jgi:transcriptional regulator with GAF, ATPase, and Fis domain